MPLILDYIIEVDVSLIPINRNASKLKNIGRTLITPILKVACIKYPMTPTIIATEILSALFLTLNAGTKMDPMNVTYKISPGSPMVAAYSRYSLCALSIQMIVSVPKYLKLCSCVSGT